MARSMPKIIVALENQQANHQTSMVKIEGMIKIQPISILIDPGESLSYLSPRIVEMCKLSQEKKWKILAGTTSHKYQTKGH